ncbi:anoctamin-4-like isoform X7 [Mytilus edulis]|uniref:anoctamin-4-like isoform X7 n=1 Tax=Mytilus edulis TaxID=6550 RepID=UPI0039F09F2E
MDHPRPPPIGFELQGADQAQIDVGFNQPPPQEVTPSTQPLYPNPHDQTEVPMPPPPPIGFEGQMTDSNGRNGNNKAEADDYKGNQQKIPLDLGPVNEEEKLNVTEDDNEDSSLIQSKSPKKVINEIATLYFRDKKSKIDYVLAYEDEQDEKKKERRQTFQDNLTDEGLILEFEEKENSINKKTSFVKVHCPWELLAKYAEITNMKMPLLENDMDEELTGFVEHCFSYLPSPFELSKDIIQDEPNYFTAPFNRDRVDQFIIKDKDTFFTNAQRSRIVYEILARTWFEHDKKGKKRIGVSNMVNNGSYTAAFPLHDGRYLSEHSILASGKDNDRHLLYETWAKPGVWYKYQPLDHVRTYFGEKIAIYFAWLGYYTSALFPAAALGLAVFIFGLATFMDDKPSNDICDPNGAGNFTMCPLCDGRCTYWKLESSCRYSRATYLFDNYGTMIFAVVMALWASFFQEFWKRKQHELEYDWDIADFESEEETLRPEFEAAISNRRTHPVTKREEPFVPSYSKCIRYGTTLGIIVFFLCVVLAAVFGVILYRVVISGVLYASTDGVIKSRATIIASVTAACINFVIILILNFVYGRIALFLTDLEQHRTQTEWEDAFTFKMFLFQFVNYYSTVVYIAFFKGKFVGRPGDYNYSLLDKRQEECDPAGCLIEVCIQLGIIMVGKQALNNFKEILLPKIMVWFKSRKAKNEEKKEDIVYSRWEQDYNLADQPKMGLFDEYLEMVIQYGFVTIFVAAFPLAPLFALLNNIIEIRLDAYKFVTQWKRPMAARAQDIGIWFGILRGISAVAVITNAAIIAFTAEFIPKMVYRYAHSENESLEGYMNYSLSVFNVADFQKKSIPSEIPPELGNVTQCRFRGFYEPAGPHEYQFTMAYWEVLAARLAFIVVFENLVVFLTWLVMYLVPDIPYKVKMQMLRENFLSKEALYRAESIKFSPVRGGGGSDNDTNVTDRTIF